jgi:hypothetical protein
LPEIDEIIKTVSLGGKIRLVVDLPDSKDHSKLTYEL